MTLEAFRLCAVSPYEFRLQMVNEVHHHKLFTSVDCPGQEVEMRNWCFLYCGTSRRMRYTLAKALDFLDIQAGVLKK